MSPLIMIMMLSMYRIDTKPFADALLMTKQEIYLFSPLSRENKLSTDFV